MSASETTRTRVTTESPLVRGVLTVVALSFLLFFLVLPLVAIFGKALEEGILAYGRAIVDPDTLSAIRLTLLTVVVSVPINTLFGIVAAWAIAKFEFRGKQILITLIDLPFSVSPVISGMMFVLLFGAQGVLGPWLVEHDWQIIFTPLGIMLATLFVTFPFVARELIPLLQALGTDQEEAALTLGASGWQTFWQVTFPSMRWGLLYGVILLSARALGEFGAVSVVSGHIRGATMTMPLQVETLYNDYQFVSAFAVASLLAILAVVTLVLKSIAQWRTQEDMRAERI